MSSAAMLATHPSSTAIADRETVARALDAALTRALHAL
jgi:hypothetical protein